MRERFMGIFFETPAAPSDCWRLARTIAYREAVEKIISLNLSLIAYRLMPRLRRFEINTTEAAAANIPSARTAGIELSPV